MDIKKLKETRDALQAEIKGLEETYQDYKRKLASTGADLNAKRAELNKVKNALELLAPEKKEA